MIKSNKKYRGILFDMDGVIVNTNSLYENCQKQILLKNNLSISEINWKKYSGSTSYEVFNDILNKKNIIKPSAEELNNQHKNNFLFNSLNDVKLVDGVLDVLPFLKDRRIKIGLVTSTCQSITSDILGKLNLLQYFDVVVCADDVKYKKPNPEPYTLAVKKLKLKTTECLIVEDSKNGIISANSAKIDCVAINYTKNKFLLNIKKVCFLKNFKELFGYLKSNVLRYE